MSERTTVLVVDDHPVVREGLGRFLSTHPDIELVGEAGDGAEAIAKVGELVPDVVLLDLVMPELDGVEVIRHVSTLSPATKVVVLTSFGDAARVVTAVKAGAAGFLLKDAEPAEIVEAIRAVRRGGAVLNPMVAARLVRELADREADPLLEQLTARELEVLRLIAIGCSNREIAAKLVLSEKTVKTHVSNVLGKLQLADRTQAAIFALKKRLVALDHVPDG